MIICVDFDGTLVEHDYPRIGPKRGQLLEILIEKRKAGDKVILWTCRNGKTLEEAVKWCRDHGLEFDAVNEDLPEIKKSFDGKSCKVYGDIYIDDRNVDMVQFEREHSGAAGLDAHTQNILKSLF